MSPNEPAEQSYEWKRAPGATAAPLKVATCPPTPPQPVVEVKPLTSVALERQLTSPRLGQVRTLAAGRSPVFNASVQVVKSLRYGRVAYDVALHVVPGVQVKVNPEAGMVVPFEVPIVHVLVADVPTAMVVQLAPVRLLTSVLSPPFKPTCPVEVEAPEATVP